MKKLICTILALLLFTGCGLQKGNHSPTARQPLPGTSQEMAGTPSLPEPAAVKGTLKVHFLDVGQADCILVQEPSGKAVLIDAGNNGDAKLVTGYIKAQGITRLDLVGTHPHEDHIGSMDTVINTFEIGKIYMPRATTTTKTYRDVLTAIKNKGLKVTAAAAGVKMDLGPAAAMEMLAPNASGYGDLNDYSAVIKLVYGTTSFLFTGDAGEESEREMLARKYDLSSDVLKVGHHGSRTATTPAFLKAVAPQVAVISLGKDNEYGHPHKETLDSLAKGKVQVLRTDEEGTIIATSDGQKITFSK